jgi:hypothetical protein
LVHVPITSNHVTQLEHLELNAMFFSSNFALAHPQARSGRGASLTYSRHSLTNPASTPITGFDKSEA